MFEDSNKIFITSIATAIAEGKMTSEEASKLLNTLARTEERLTLVDHLPTTSQS